MSAFTTYLTFDGNAREAMKFYAENLGCDLYMMTFGESDMPCAAADKNKIMHASLLNGKEPLLMASDTSSDMPVKFVAGNNFAISYSCKDLAETEKLFNSLSKNGKITMPLQETFFAKSFGMFTDQFGINWMLILNKPH